jgi:hypothetical protein
MLLKLEIQKLFHYEKRIEMASTPQVICASQSRRAMYWDRCVILHQPAPMLRAGCTH